ncbi:MAG: hypothetical protein IPK88_05895 [Saprospiraceae bacterium]|nr:hypothetical protein [Candidatus Defluviibacterium haderslevense]
MTLIKNGFLSILVLTLITLFSSCQKELLSSETTEESTDLVSRTVPEPGNSLGKPCFTIVFPVQVQLHDGTIKVINNEGVLRDLNLKTRRLAHKLKSIINFVFPFEVILDDGTNSIITNKEELKLLLDSCNPTDKNHPDKTPCFEFVFPITLSFADGTTQSATSAENLATILREWHKLNPKATQRPSFVFPLDVLLDNGTTQTINNQEELNQIASRCKVKRGNPNHTAHCFELQFPYTVTLSDGSVKNISSELDLQELRTNKVRFKLNFPIQVKLIDSGDLVIISSVEELKRLQHSCK